MDRREIRPDDPILSLKIYEVEMCIRAVHCLERADIIYLGELVQMSYEDILALKFMGRKAARDIIETMERLGLSLGMKINGWSRAEAEQQYEERIKKKLVFLAPRIRGQQKDSTVLLDDTAKIIPFKPKENKPIELFPVHDIARQVFFGKQDVSASPDVDEDKAMEEREK